MPQGQGRIPKYSMTIGTRVRGKKWKSRRLYALF